MHYGMSRGKPKRGSMPMRKGRGLGMTPKKRGGGRRGKRY
jgi:hypothetical protein